MNPISNHHPLGDANVYHFTSFLFNVNFFVSSKHCKVDTWYGLCRLLPVVLYSRRMFKIHTKYLLEIEDSINAGLILNFFKGAISRCYCASRICANLKYCLPTINQVGVKYDIVYNPAFDIRYIRLPCFKHLIN